MAILPACLLVCAVLNSCTEDFCNQFVSTTAGTLKINCKAVPLAIDFSAARGKQLDYNTLQIEQCLLAKLDSEDGNMLKEMRLANLQLKLMRLTNLLNLSLLKDDLLTLSIVGSNMDDSLAATLPSFPLVSSLTLTNNRLTRIPSSLKGFRSLVRLELSRNMIISLELAALPTGISQLVVKENRIISVTGAKNLYSLRSLDLSQNRISSLEWMTSSQFPAICRRINLQKNRITAIRAENIDFMRELERLDLSYNSITWIMPLASLNSLYSQSINLGNNPLYCNCSLSLFGSDPLWQAQMLPACQSPTKFENLTLEKLGRSRECFEVDEAGRLSAEENQESIQTLSPVAVVCIIVGVCCLAAGTVAVGVISQRRRAVPIEQVKQAPKNLPVPVIFEDLEDKRQKLLSASMEEASLEGYYQQRRRVDVEEAEEYVFNKLNEINKNGRKLKLSEKIEVCLDLKSLQVMSIEPVDAADMCTLMVKEWPLAPCNTPLDIYLGMYYEGDMEEWPITALNTRTCSNANINCLLEATNESLNLKNSPNAKQVKKDYLSPIELRVPPPSAASLSPNNFDNNSTKLINNIEGW